MFVAVADGREWWNATGTQKYEAEFVELRDGDVKLRFQDGTIASIPLNRLSPASRDLAVQSAPALTKSTTRSSASSPANANAREWTDATGTQRIKAEFVESNGGVVSLRLPDGNIRSVRLEKLSPADQMFVRQEASAAVDDSSSIAGDIKKSVLALGYPESSAADMVQLERGWNIEYWKGKVHQLRRAPSKPDSASAAQVEKEAVRALYRTIAKEIAADADFSTLASCSYLPSVIQKRKANCLGYAQLFYILGNSVGLRVSVINVLEPPNDHFQIGGGHVACVVQLSDGHIMMVDVINKLISNPFVFEKTFAKVGDFWERDPKINSSTIHRRIQRLDERGIVACINANLGEGYGAAGDRDQAIVYLTKAIELNPKYALAYTNRGAFYAESGTPTKAIPDFTKAIELDPKHAEAYCNRGNVYLQMGRQADAIRDFTKAIELKPRYPLAYTSRGSAYAKSSQWEDAVSDLTEAIKLDPKFTHAYGHRAIVYAILGKKGEAKSDLKMAVLLDPQLEEGAKKTSEIFQLDR
jgi:tetratricopeptide (TPR) repeat protein